MMTHRTAPHRVRNSRSLAFLFEQVMDKNETLHIVFYLCMHVKPNIKQLKKTRDCDFPLPQSVNNFSECFLTDIVARAYGMSYFHYRGCILIPPSLCLD